MTGTVPPFVGSDLLTRHSRSGLATVLTVGAIPIWLGVHGLAELVLERLDQPFDVPEIRARSPPSLDKQQVSKYSQHQAIGGRLRFWNRSFKASCSSPWTVFLSWAASTRSCW